MKTNKTEWLDTLRALATLGVIIIHVSSPLVNMAYLKNMPFWWVGNVVDSAVRFAVPVFLMLSGATLLGNKINISNFYKRRFTRVFVPFLFWIIAYLVFRWCMLFPAQQPTSFSATVQWGVDLFLKEGVSKHFWYIYMILFIYLLLPFANKSVMKLPKTSILYLLLAWLVFTILLKSVPLNLYGWSGNYASKLLGFMLHSGYLLLGYYLFKAPAVTQSIRIWAAVVFVSSILFCAVYTYFISKNGNRPDLSMYSYLSVNTIVQSLSFFILLKDVKANNQFIVKLQAVLSNYSYGIYLVHIMVIGLLFRRGIYWNFSHPLLSLPALSILVAVCSFVIIYILRKIPFGKYISG